ncbi:hypothetical protein JAAARDRAFT_188127 [Jaapia argillacea MUCL 33604]|uniref:Uncharacterized protein n=1 Tax=Jaapia argillacea MUCL 33604 TaxID=933084 RepID=A0A067QCP9_9AGAM|nr:hypothetical protein JAAARDRAFT_188127 [Jaapia argillacea MUCL 33604]
MNGAGLEKAPLNSPNLRSVSLGKLDKPRAISSFIQTQKLFASDYAVEGRTFQASFHLAASPCSPAAPKKPIEVPGFDTPILKPRVPIDRSPPPHELSRQNSTEPVNSEPRPPTEASSHRRQSRPAKKLEKLVKRTADAPNAGGVGAVTPSEAQKKKERLEADIDHAARLTERRERRRVKRALVNPVETEKPSQDGEGEYNMRDRKGEKKAAKEKKPRALAGLALMNGFAATNVGKNRLTLKPAPLAGVFSKGRASAKTHNNKKKMRESVKNAQAFSEFSFLNKISRETPSSSSSSLSSFVISPPKRKRPTSRKLSDSSKPVKKVRLSDPPAPKEPAASTTVAESAIWDIEDDQCDLPSEVTSVLLNANTAEGTVLLDTRALGWDVGGFPPPAVAEDKSDSTPKRLNSRPSEVLGSINHESNPDAPNQGVDDQRSSSLGPWESASQLRPIDLPDQPAMERPLSVSKYFFKPEPAALLRQSDISGENCANHPPLERHYGNNGEAASSHVCRPAPSGHIPIFACYGDASQNFAELPVSPARKSPYSSQRSPQFLMSLRPPSPSTTVDTLDLASGAYEVDSGLSRMAPRITTRLNLDRPSLGDLPPIISVDEHFEDGNCFDDIDVQEAEEAMLWEDYADEARFHATPYTLENVGDGYYEPQTYSDGYEEEQVYNHDISLPDDYGAEITLLQAADWEVECEDYYCEEYYCDEQEDYQAEYSEIGEEGFVADQPYFDECEPAEVMDTTDYPNETQWRLPEDEDWTDCSDAQSFISDSSVASITPMEQFRRGRTLLLDISRDGVGCQDSGQHELLSGGRPGVSSLSRAEQEVVASLKGHWRPHKL